MHQHRQKPEQALATAGLVAELSPGKPLEPEATLLEGRLNARLGLFGNAVQVYQGILDRYRPVRDEIDALLARQEDPVRYFEEVVARSDKAFDVGSVLPPLAVKWAASQAEVTSAMTVVAGLDQGRKDVGESGEIADRIEAALTRADGLGAFPHLGEGYARAEAVQNAGARLQGGIADRLAELLAGGLPGGGRARLAAARADRAALEPRVRSLPATPAEVEERVARMRDQVAEVDRAAFQVGYLVEACQAAIAGAQVWLDEHRDDVKGEAPRVKDFMEEMRAHAGVVAAYQEELRQLRQEILTVQDAVRGAELGAGEAELRAEYLEVLGEERGLLAAGRAAASPDAGREAERLEALVGRIEALAGRAEAVKRQLAARARAGIQDLRGRLAAEKRLLAAEGAELGGAQGDARSLVGRVAYRSVREVRAQLQRLVLRADAGLVDVAWLRMQGHVDRIQKLAADKAANLSGQDEEFQGALKEVE